MRKRKPHLLFLLATCLLIEVAFFQGLAVALGSSSSHDEPWNPDHIDRLPPDVRNVLLHSCRGRIQAAHYFATYLDHARTVRLHFENLRCDGEQRFKRRDSCLHEEFVAFGAGHRLMKRYYAPCND
ncbi:MAG: hypothetical protein CL533_21785 [Afipia sp.]|nr:hypothetical protein [Afipia sp.]MAH71832.1 hypothetical protein [Afipia sp.]OUX59124.1 MAG: hypothetical protein CBB64_21730 [Afipia sp. TMED4]OUX60287.1 MAG: hypothetical protein CBB64_14605 [Afipia sp. TMED4]HBP84642.1 hypothetical protein [Gammaproteobacteria bacterium]